ncbi:MAG: hypothetical protein P4L16_07370 [Chlamydiales bacterium]|nr:hypothetical protein [Chlamydiales bacterium]
MSSPANNATQILAAANVIMRLSQEITGLLKPLSEGENSTQVNSVSAFAIQIIYNASIRLDNLEYLQEASKLLESIKQKILSDSEPSPSASFEKVNTLAQTLQTFKLNQIENIKEAAKKTFSEEEIIPIFLASKEGLLNLDTVILSSGSSKSTSSSRIEPPS